MDLVNSRVPRDLNLKMVHYERSMEDRTGSAARQGPA